VGSFERVATYDVPGQVAEIIVTTPDGKWALVAVHRSGQDVLVVVDLAKRAITTEMSLQSGPTHPLPIWGAKPTREWLASSSNGNCHAGLRT
jgi:hypothetical protein